DAVNGLTAWMNRVNSPVTTLVASGGFGFDGVSTNDVAVNKEFTPLIWTGVLTTSTGSEECAIAAEGSRELCRRSRQGRVARPRWRSRELSVLPPRIGLRGCEIAWRRGAYSLAIPTRRPRRRRNGLPRRTESRRPSL